MATIHELSPEQNGKIQTIDLYELFTEDELAQVNELFLEAFTRKFKVIPQDHELITQIEYSSVLDEEEN
tara:strand:+ start:317 stop:523 length:207 start_codon:yes stop_codon:yes gene_type:complete